MRKPTLFLKLIGVFMAALLMAGTSMAQEDTPDFANDPLAGPSGTGTIALETPGNIMMSFGARARIIPTSENDWDFGFAGDLGGKKLLSGLVDKDFFNIHVNESGWVTDDYIRTETQVYFNAMPRDRKWSVHAALEFDRPVDTSVVDDRGGTDSNSDFGLERLRGTYALSPNLRFNAGWDVWAMPDPAGLTYGDDAPGFWLDGDYGTFDYSMAYFKMSENNWGTDFDSDWLTDSDDSDRDLYAGYLNYNMSENHKLTGLYMYDRIRNVGTGTMRDRILVGGKKELDGLDDLGVGVDPNLVALTDTVEGLDTPKTDSHYMGLIYEGSLGLVNYFVEGIYQFGQADDTGLSAVERYSDYEDYDINAFAFAGDLEFDLGDSVGWGFKPHVGFIYTSGDDDPEDDNLEGYTGSLTFQRWTTFGGENTIVADGNPMMGTMLYSYLPGLYGNGTPVVVGGLPNTTGLGTARGDNPGLTMSSVGFTLTPKKYLMFKSNVNAFWWNEDISVGSWLLNENPLADGFFEETKVDSGYVGTEWDNELLLALSKNTFLKGQAAVLVPGSVMDDVTSARSTYKDLTGEVVTGEESDDVAYRLGLEFIWQF
ncbi:MAG: hypothetical protein K9K81_11575 [Desulfobacteraceae bacterium]|nr:hypothetical protein [Desulfobacteraceae bacterium]